jgi:DNA sulfur modification protein DndC
MINVNQIRKVLSSHYTNSNDNYPWIVTYSGGKDSTTVLQIVLDLMIDIGYKKCDRQVYIVSNDTMVESPLVIKHLHNSLKKITKFIKKSKLPITVKITRPYVNDTFWFNLIGKGYPTPNNLFRWCTTRLKIDPTTRYIKEQISSNGSVYMLLGTKICRKHKSCKKY